MIERSNRCCSSPCFLAPLPSSPQSQQRPTADDRAAVEQLRKAGVVLTETTGVVTGAFIKDTVDMTDDNFAALGSLKNLKTLNISSKKLNDRTLGLLTGMTALEALLTDSAQFTDAGLTQLTKFPNLKHIAFIHTSLKAQGFHRHGPGGTGRDAEPSPAWRRRLSVQRRRHGRRRETDAIGRPPHRSHLSNRGGQRASQVAQQPEDFVAGPKPATLRQLVEPAKPDRGDARCAGRIESRSRRFS